MSLLDSVLLIHERVNDTSIIYSLIERRSSIFILLIHERVNDTSVCRISTFFSPPLFVRFAKSLHRSKELDEICPNMQQNSIHPGGKFSPLVRGEESFPPGTARGSRNCQNLVAHVLSREIGACLRLFQTSVKIQYQKGKQSMCLNVYYSNRSTIQENSICKLRSYIHPL